MELGNAAIGEESHWRVTRKHVGKAFVRGKEREGEEEEEGEGGRQAGSVAAAVCHRIVLANRKVLCKDAAKGWVALYLAN